MPYLSPRVAPSRLASARRTEARIEGLLACVTLSFLLLGCSAREERQEQAEAILDVATEIGQKVQATALEVQERTEKLQNGIEKVKDAASDFKEGMTEVRGALDGNE